jgi:hypothetical protein
MSRVDARTIKAIADELERRRRAAEWDAWVNRYRTHNDRLSEKYRAAKARGEER